MSSRHWRFLLPLSFLHAALLAFNIGRESLWLDELMSLEAARGSWPSMWAFFTQLPEQHPLYYVLLRGWLVFGSSEAALRSLSAVFALASVWLLYFLTLELFDDLTARIAALLLCLSPFHIYYGQEARMYSLLGFLSVASSLLLVSWLRGGRRSLLAAYCAVAILGAYTHFFFLLLLAAHLAFVLHRDGSVTATVKRLVLAQALVGAAYLPWALLILRDGPESPPWKGIAHVAFGIPYALLRFSLGYSELMPNSEWKSRLPELVRNSAGILALAVPSVGALAVAGVRSIWRGPRDGRLALWSAAFPAALVLVGSVLVILQGERYLMVSFPFFVLVLAAGMVWLLRTEKRVRLAGVAAGLAYLFVMGHVLRAYYFHPDFGKEQWAEVGEHLEVAAAPGDMIVVHRGFAITNLRHYYSPQPGQRVLRSDSLTLADVQSAERVWLVVRGSELTSELLARMPPSYRPLSERLFPKQSGIRVVLLVRS